MKCSRTLVKKRREETPTSLPEHLNTCCWLDLHREKQSVRHSNNGGDMIIHKHLLYQHFNSTKCCWTLNRLSTQCLNGMGLSLDDLYLNFQLSGSKFNKQPELKFLRTFKCSLASLSSVSKFKYQYIGLWFKHLEHRTVKWVNMLFITVICLIYS